MKLFFSDTQLDHRPKQFMVHGRIVDPFENPDRATALVGALERIGLVRTEPVDFGWAPILAVHADHYLAFLEEAYDRFMELPNHGPEVLPSAHAYRGAGPDLGARGAPHATGIVGRRLVRRRHGLRDHGRHLPGGLCLRADRDFRAEAVLAGERAAFSLCRPPGHHAYADRASGFCFLNNAATAAEILRRGFPKVAVVDFDTHHGDGTQAIFYARADVFYGSVHTDPSAYYPHFAGYADETGFSAGEGANLNLPLAWGADDEAFVDANRRLALAVQAHGAEAVVISAGWDAHKDDPLSRLAVTTDAFARIGEVWGRLGLPSLIVQEGGYSLAATAEAAPAFVAAFREAAAPR